MFQGDLDLVAPPAGAIADEPGAQPRMAGLAGLASRAGEALGSFVAPQAYELATASGTGARPESALAQRVDSPVYVDTSRPDASSSAVSQRPQVNLPGRTFSRVGGGEPEIPAWFESAARKMLDQRSDGAGMTLTELVLVNAIPQRQIAASTRSAAGHGGGGHAHGKHHNKHQDEKHPDVGKLAHDVYLEVLKLIDAARERSGDPYQ